MKKIFIAIVVVLIAVWFGLDLYAKMNPEKVSLRSQKQRVSISPSAKYVELKRGTCVYTLKKEAVLNSQKYIVEHTYDLFWKQPVEPTPWVLYTAGYVLVPYSPEMKEFTDSMKGGDTDVQVTSKNMGKITTTMLMSKKYNATNFSAGILPANTNVRYAAGKITPGDIITVSGVKYSHLNKKIAGQKRQMSQCSKNTKVLYVTGLRINKK